MAGLFDEQERQLPETVSVTIEQLQHLLEVLCANQIDVAKMWLVAAINQAKRDIRERKG